MKGNELVWRTLADKAIEGKRRWSNLSDLAFHSGVPITTTHLATRKLIDIGALSPFPSGGFSVVSPEKILTLLCAWRNLSKDAIGTTDRKTFLKLAKEKKLPVILGGPDAAIKLLGGKNKVADFSKGIVYVPPRLLKATELPIGDDLVIFGLDERAELDWDGYTSFAQTYADLFASPGWQSAEFFLALRDKFLKNRDWNQDE